LRLQIKVFRLQIGQHFPPDGALEAGSEPVAPVARGVHGEGALLPPTIPPDVSTVDSHSLNPYNYILFCSQTTLDNFVGSVEERANLKVLRDDFYKSFVSLNSVKVSVSKCYFLVTLLLGERPQEGSLQLQQEGEEAEELGDLGDLGPGLVSNAQGKVCTRTFTPHCWHAFFYFLQHILHAALEKITVKRPETPPPFELAGHVGGDQLQVQQPPVQQPHVQQPQVQPSPQGEELLVRDCQSFQLKLDTNDAMMVTGVTSCDQKYNLLVILSSLHRRSRPCGDLGSA